MELEEKTGAGSSAFYEKQAAFVDRTVDSFNVYCHGDDGRMADAVHIDRQ